MLGYCHVPRHALHALTWLAVSLNLKGASARRHILNEVPLKESEFDGRKILIGKETTASSKPFFVLPSLINPGTVVRALQAASNVAMDDHNDEADWQPAYEVYVMERSIPLPGVATPAIVTALETMNALVLPFVKEKYACDHCVSCTGFVRRYLPEERVGVPSHFDVTAFATVILTLSPSTNYTGGFFVQPGAHMDSRAFVPLEAGDVVVHDFTLNHGIEVLQGGRYSLIVWVSETQAACDGSATPWHANRALNGDLVAQHILGIMYDQGNGAPQDDEKALHWTLLAAKGGLANAQFSAATMYFEGRATAANASRALYWYAQAAMQGDASAQIILGRMYAEGIGTAVDPAKAQYWMRQGAAQEGARLVGPIAGWSE